MNILGIETSCDETAASIIQGKNGKINIIANTVASQIPIHKKYGGIVPEVAARAHIKKIIPVIEETFKKSGFSLSNIDLISVTHGPGLVTSLLVGIETAKALSFTKKIPLIGINHLKAHIRANFVKNPNIPYPAVSLIASGGHTEISLFKKNSYKRLGQTRDDAAGECFDKTAKILGLGYPGGPEISKKAKKWEDQTKAIKDKFDFSLPRPMINSDNFDFSFSGLKTAVLYLAQDNKDKLKNKHFIQSISYETQQAIVEVLTKKTIKATKKFQAKSILLSGGVAANKTLRQTLAKKAKSLDIEFFVPEFKLCTDNASMIATTAYFDYKNLNKSEKEKLNHTWETLQADPNLKI